MSKTTENNGLLDAKKISSSELVDIVAKLDVGQNVWVDGSDSINELRDYSSSVMQLLKKFPDKSFDHHVSERNLNYNIIRG